MRGTYLGWGAPTLAVGYLAWTGYLLWGYLPWTGKDTYPGQDLPWMGGTYLGWWYLPYQGGACLAEVPTLEKGLYLFWGI